MFKKIMTGIFMLGMMSCQPAPAFASSDDDFRNNYPKEMHDTIEKLVVLYHADKICGAFIPPQLKERVYKEVEFSGISVETLLREIHEEAAMLVVMLPFSGLTVSNYCHGVVKTEIERLFF